MKLGMHNALESALKANRKFITAEAAVDIAEIVLRTVADYVEQKQPYAKVTIAQLREGENALDSETIDDPEEGED